MPVQVRRLRSFGRRTAGRDGGAREKRGPVSYFQAGQAPDRAEPLNAAEETVILQRFRESLIVAPRFAAGCRRPWTGTPGATLAVAFCLRPQIPPR